MPSIGALFTLDFEAGRQCPRTINSISNTPVILTTVVQPIRLPMLSLKTNFFLPAYVLYLYPSEAGKQSQSHRVKPTRSRPAITANLPV